MKVKPLKIKIKEPTPSAADRLYAKHQAIRKEKGLPDPSEYKKKLSDMRKESTEIIEQHAEKGRFRPTMPHNVSSVKTASPRNGADSADVKLKEAANAAQQAAIAVNMKKAGKKPKSEDVDEGETGPKIGRAHF